MMDIEIDRLPKVDWDSQPLGKMTDASLGMRLNMSTTAVKHARKQRGIPAFAPRGRGINWSSVVGLGQRLDSEIAKELGVTSTAVALARTKLGIAPFTNRKWVVDWAHQPLGKEPDRVIAQRLGCTHVVVGRARQRLGIAPFGDGNKRIEIAWDDQPFGIVTDGELALRLGVNVSQVCRQRLLRGIKSFKKRAAKEKAAKKIERQHKRERLIEVWQSVNWHENETDRQIADRLGLTRDAVARKRRQLGHVRDGGQIGIEWDQQPLGKVGDTALAKQLGCNPAAVRRARRQRCIKAYRAKFSFIDLPGIGVEPDYKVATACGVSPSFVAKRRRMLGLASPSRKRSKK